MSVVFSWRLHARQHLSSAEAISLVEQLERCRVATLSFGDICQPVPSGCNLSSVAMSAPSVASASISASFVISVLHQVSPDVLLLHQCLPHLLCLHHFLPHLFVTQWQSLNCCPLAYKKGVPLTNCEGFARTQNEDLLLVLEQEQGNELQRNAALAQVISKIEW